MKCESDVYREPGMSFLGLRYWRPWEEGEEGGWLKIPKINYYNVLCYITSIGNAIGNMLTVLFSLCFARKDRNEV